MTHMHTKHVMALSVVYVGDPVADIHSLTNVIATALQHRSEPTHYPSVHDESAICEGTQSQWSCFVSLA